MALEEVLSADAVESDELEFPEVPNARKTRRIVPKVTPIAIKAPLLEDFGSFCPDISGAVKSERFGRLNLYVLCFFEQRQSEVE